MSASLRLYVNVPFADDLGAGDVCGISIWLTNTSTDSHFHEKLFGP